MENASKALIIAGAILLSIAIIGIGMTVFNNVSPLVSGANMDEQEVAAFNQKFLSYEGTQKGNRVRSLIETVNANNRSNVDDLSKQVAIGGGVVNDDGNTGDAINTYNKMDVLTGRNYIVNFNYDTTGVGIITEVVITNTP